MIATSGRRSHGGPDEVKPITACTGRSVIGWPGRPSAATRTGLKVSYQMNYRYQHCKPRAHAAGFTLIEVMVVVVILGILAAIVVPRVMDRPDVARITKAKQDIRAIESALNLYKLDNYSYPTTDQGLEALVQKPQGEPEPLN